jgi:hypothetical protein
MVPSRSGTSKKASSNPIPGSARIDGECVLRITCRPVRLCIRANICGKCVTTSGWRESSGSSNSSGPDPSKVAHKQSQQA